MKKIRIAIDTSVISGIKDECFKNEVILLFSELCRKKHKIEAMIPQRVIMELIFAPRDVVEFFKLLVDLECISIEKSLHILKKHKRLRRKLYREVVAKTLKVDKKIKKSDLNVYTESVLLNCDYLITYNNKDLIDNKKLLYNSIKSYKNFKITKIIHPKVFISRICGRL